MSQNLQRDLFGNLTALPSGRRGRPAHQWSQEAENAVIMGCALGWSTERIARGLGVTPPTLRKHYFSALKLRDMARDRYELWRATRLQQIADGGNVGAFRQLEEIFKRMDRARAAASIEEAQAKPAALGKKAQAREDASRAVAQGWGGDLDPGNLH